MKIKIQILKDWTLRKYRNETSQHYEDQMAVKRQKN